MCPACTDKRLHAPADWTHHPLAGHGYQNGQGWSRPDLDPAQHVEPEFAGVETSARENLGGGIPSKDDAGEVEGSPQ